MKSIGSQNSKGSSALGRLGLEGLFDILVLQLYSLVDHFSLEGRGEVFTLSTSISFFDNTSRCYFVFASLFPYSLYFTFCQDICGTFMNICHLELANPLTKCILLVIGQIQDVFNTSRNKSSSPSIEAMKICPRIK